MIRDNGDRYCKNPYFLHSLCTSNGPTKAYTEIGSIQSLNGPHNGLGTYYGAGPVGLGSRTELRTVSEFGNMSRKKKLRQMGGSKASDGNFAGFGKEGRYGARPQEFKKKTRPFSAPRHQGLRSQNLKNRVANNLGSQELSTQASNLRAGGRPQTSKGRQLGAYGQQVSSGQNFLGGSSAGGLALKQSNQQMMETVNEQPNLQYFDNGEHHQLYDQEVDHNQMQEEEGDPNALMLDE
mmetsp:Transcript_1874/g.3264  ORF Transcript_1874/g.3264 Transcript_1874/m.3264 type:complete len:237 (+) Transcript_1874:542-1252(+)